MLQNTPILTDLSANNFGFTQAYKTLVDSDALHLLLDGRINFDPRSDKTVEMLAMRLMKIELRLKELQRTVERLEGMDGC